MNRIDVELRDDVLTHQGEHVEGRFVRPVPGAEHELISSGRLPPSALLTITASARRPRAPPAGAAADPIVVLVRTARSGRWTTRRSFRRGPRSVCLPSKSWL
jgi:hypothetical protein